MTACVHDRRERCLFLSGRWYWVCLVCGASWMAAPPAGCDEVNPHPGVNAHLTGLTDPFLRTLED